MILQNENMLKVHTLVLAAILHFTSTLSQKAIPVNNNFRNLNPMMLAKGGSKGDYKLIFKGKQFTNVTYATRHEDIVLECEAGGIPSPTIHWLKNEERIQQGATTDYADDAASFEEMENLHNQPMLKLGKVKSKLYLDCITDSNEAKYTCVAETPTERITRSTILKFGKHDSLSAEPRESCMAKKLLRGERARIHLWTAVRIEYQGAPVQLFCRVEGYPAPTCSWKYSPDSGTPIQDNIKHTILPNGDLLLKEISFMKNMGEYICTCENDLGVDKIITFLYPLAS